LVASFPCGCGFFSLLWFNFSQIAPEWQFGSSNMVLNCFKLQGNIWQLPGHGLCSAKPKSRDKGARAVMPIEALSETALAPARHGGRHQVMVIRR
jgi:hypothetical protein